MINPADNANNQRNPNIGTDGTNRQYDQAQGNRGKQLNPTWSEPEPEPKPSQEDLDDMDQGDVFWYSGCGD